MKNESTPSVLQRGKYHHHPADGDEPEDWEWFDADVICDACIDAVIVRAVDFHAQAAEIAALKAALKTANANAEKFQREWYLRGDEIAALRAERDALHKALEVIIDIEDDTDKNPPENRCYIAGAWRTAIDEARAAMAQAGSAQQRPISVKPPYPGPQISIPRVQP